MARLHSLEIDGYRSIGDSLFLRFPNDKPLVLLGENNAGKSNVVKALELVLGDRWPGSHTPEDHEFFGRDRTRPGVAFRITVELRGCENTNRATVEQLELRVAPHATSFEMQYEDGGTAWVNNFVREQCPVVVVGADRNLRYQLSYASQWTLLARLTKRFHKALISDPTRADRLRTHFESLQRMFKEVDEFSRFAEQLAAEVDTLSTGFRYGLEVDFSAYDPSNYFRSLSVQAKAGTERRSFDELGTGQEQILALSFAYAYATAFTGETAGLVLVIEEPEAHLHPLAQEWLANQMGRFVAAGIQLVITTHSPAFVDLSALEGIVLVSKDGETGASVVTQLGANELARYCQEHHGLLATPGTIADFYNWSATNEIKSGMFARMVVLVEGETESLALPKLFAKVGLDAAKHGIAVIPVGGRKSLARWWRLYNAYGIPVYVIYDNDTGDDRNGAGRDDLLATLNLDDDMRAELSNVRGFSAGPGVAVFGPDFESVMRSTFQGYAGLESRAADAGLRGKPLVARWVAERLDVGGDSCIRDLARAIGERAGIDNAHVHATEPAETRRAATSSVSLAAFDDGTDLSDDGLNTSGGHILDGSEQLPSEALLGTNEEDGNELRQGRAPNLPVAAQPAPPNHSEFVLLWNSQIIQKLSPRAKSRFRVGRFAAIEGGIAVLVLPNAIHRDRCDEVRSEVEQALSAHFGQHISIQLVVEPSGNR